MAWRLHSLFASISFSIIFGLAALFRSHVLVSRYDQISSFPRMSPFVSLSRIPALISASFYWVLGQCPFHDLSLWVRRHDPTHITLEIFFSSSCLSPAQARLPSRSTQSFVARSLLLRSVVLFLLKFREALLVNRCFLRSSGNVALPSYAKYLRLSLEVIRMTILPFSPRI